MIEPIITDIWNETKEDTKLTNIYLGYFNEADIKDSDYPFVLAYNNTFSDQDHKDAVKPGVRYLVDGRINTRFYSDELLTLSAFFPIWRYNFVLETRGYDYKLEGDDDTPTIDLDLTYMKLINSSIYPDRVIDKAVWCLEFVSEYSLEIKYS